MVLRWALLPNTFLVAWAKKCHSASSCPWVRILLFPLIGTGVGAVSPWCDTAAHEYYSLKDRARCMATSHKIHNHCMLCAAIKWWRIMWWVKYSCHSCAFHSWMGFYHGKATPKLLGLCLCKIGFWNKLIELCEVISNWVALDITIYFSKTGIVA